MWRLAFISFIATGVLICVTAGAIIFGAGHSVLDAADSHQLLRIDRTTDPPSLMVWDSTGKQWLVLTPSRTSK